MSEYIYQADPIGEGQYHYTLVGELVRCRECKHSQHWYSDKCRCFLWSKVGIDVFEDGFCNYGKREQTMSEEKTCNNCVWFVWVGDRYACCLGCCRDYERWEKKWKGENDG